MKTVRAIAGAIIAACLATTVQGITADYGDLILGFRCTDGTGSGLSLEVNLGSINNYRGKTGSWKVTNLSAADLSSIYGSTWYTNSSLYYGIVGYDGTGDDSMTLWASRPESTPGKQSKPWKKLSVSSVYTARGLIDPLYEGATVSMRTILIATTNSASSIIANSRLSGSYTFQEYNGDGSGSNSFAKFNPSVDSCAAVASTKAFTSIDLYQMKGNAAAVYVGTFSLFGDGSLVFSSSPAQPGQAVATAVAKRNGSLLHNTIRTENKHTIHRHRHK
jgi:hypothetical protein